MQNSTEYTDEQIQELAALSGLEEDMARELAPELLGEPYYKSEDDIPFDLDEEEKDDLAEVKINRGSGFIQLERDIQDTPIFADAELLKIYVWCRFRARYIQKPTAQMLSAQKIIRLNKGQFIFGRVAASRILNITESSLYRKMKKLKMLGAIDIQRVNSDGITLCSLVTVHEDAISRILACAEEVSIEQDMNSNGTGEEQKANTNREGKEGRHREEGQEVIPDWPSGVSQGLADDYSAIAHEEPTENDKLVVSPVNHAHTREGQGGGHTLEEGEHHHLMAMCIHLLCIKKRFESFEALQAHQRKNARGSNNLRFYTPLQVGKMVLAAKLEGEDLNYSIDHINTVVKKTAYSDCHVDSDDLRRLEGLVAIYEKEKDVLLTRRSRFLLE